MQRVSVFSLFSRDALAIFQEENSVKTFKWDSALSYSLTPAQRGLYGEFSVVGCLLLTFTASQMIYKVIVQPLAVAQLVPAFVVVCCPVRSAHWVLIGGTVFETHTACFMSTICLADSERWTVDIKARMKVWKTNRKYIYIYIYIYILCWDVKAHVCDPFLDHRNLFSVPT